MLPAGSFGEDAEDSPAQTAALARLGGGEVQGPGHGRGRGRGRRRDHPGARVAALARRYRQEAAGELQAAEEAYLWLVGNGRMVVMVLIIVPIPPFPTNQE